VSNQFIPSAEMAPPVPDKLTPDQRIVLWLDLMDAGEQLLLAGLRRQLRSEDEVRAAYRRWYAERMDEHDRTLRRMLEGFSRRGVNHGR
jgi:hypothetical protein